MHACFYLVTVNLIFYLSTVSPPQATKRKLSETEDENAVKKSEDKTDEKSEDTPSKQLRKGSITEVTLPADNPELQIGALKCVAILPGLGSYDDSSDSDCSSDSEEESSGCQQQKLDILGRQIVPPAQKEAN